MFKMLADEATNNVDPSRFITVPEWALMLVFSLVIPIVNGVLTKISLSSRIKGAITIVLNAVAALLTTNSVDGTGVISKQTFVLFVVGVITSLATYTNVYRPLGLTSSEPHGKLGPRFGIGPSTSGTRHV